MKTIDIEAREWFDKVNGNSYFAALIIIDLGTKEETRYAIPFQYGYGDHYKDKAFDVLEETGAITDREHYNNGSAERLWQYCERKGIILRPNKRENCKKRELKSLFSNIVEG